MRSGQSYVFHPHITASLGLCVQSFGAGSDITKKFYYKNSSHTHIQQQRKTVASTMARRMACPDTTSKRASEQTNGRYFDLINMMNSSHTMFSDYQDCENRNDNDDNNNVWWMCNVEKKTAASNIKWKPHISALLQWKTYYIVIDHEIMNSWKKSIEREREP